MHPFFAMAWDPLNEAAIETAEKLAKRAARIDPGADRMYIENGFFLMCLDPKPACASILPLGLTDGEPGGVVFGTLFRKSQSSKKRISNIGTDEAIRIKRSYGEHLYKAYWGSYVAFVRSRGSITVLADPAASLPCHYTKQLGVTLLFSDLESCSFIDTSQFSVNEQFISKLLVYDKIQTGATGLNEVTELGAGESLIIDHNGLKTKLAWDPHLIAHNVEQLSPTRAAEALRAACDCVVQSWASCFEEVAVSLSGGLDSAIVLSSLAGINVGSAISAFHNLLDSDDFPELRYAEEAARKSGVSLFVIRSSAAGDLPDINAHPPTVRPQRGFLSLPLHLPFGGVAPCRSRAVFTGQGGDHLFHARESPLTFADHVFNNGFNKATFEELLSASRLAGYSIWKVIHASMTQERLVAAEGLDTAVRNRQIRMEGLSPAGIHLDRCFPDWTKTANYTAPLKSLQIGGLAHLHESRRHAGQISGWLTHDPLVSQPLIELCLSLPTYLLCHKGISRGLAREAFGDRLPNSIRMRTSKGGASEYFSEQTEVNHKRIIGALRDGELLRRGIISNADITLLSEPTGAHTRALDRTLLSWYSIEAWLRAWSPGPTAPSVR
ncbi:MAG TPA: asparagine synthase C-terminal domain-containing protein [Hyphomonas sp.]|mgnify:CR=1 FL=1|nr:hypothetical protein [Hyphomonas sp.]HRI99673.1 asparagine synthase C-terminal domain-containing protein [Hyphomonas sp.]HRK68360.1 asparagine synthase C-terminal domain-containing protein [Hyphomonas sp.]